MTEVRVPEEEIGTDVGENSAVGIGGVARTVAAGVALRTHLKEGNRRWKSCQAIPTRIWPGAKAFASLGAD